MKTIAIIQARMGSTRLPGKVMKMLCGKTVLTHVIERVAACRLLDEVVVATTEAPSDDVVATEAEKQGARIFRGSEDDVLSRYYFAAREAQADIVVRVTSDCPLFDTGVLEAMLDRFHHKCDTGRRLDYLSNTVKRTFPRGLDAEIFTFIGLSEAWREARQSTEREHVTPYFYRHPERFVLGQFINEVDLSAHRWTLDVEEDWTLISRIYDSLYTDGDQFTTEQVLAVLRRNPTWIQVNAHVEQKKLESAK